MTATKHVSLIKKEKYDCVFNWPKGIYQCADNGLVLAKKGNYYTSYFEAFPDNIDDWYRGEGKTIKEAEDACWVKFQKATSNKKYTASQATPKSCPKDCTGSEDNICPLPFSACPLRA